MHCPLNSPVVLRAQATVWHHSYDPMVGNGGPSPIQPFATGELVAGPRPQIDLADAGFFGSAPPAERAS